MPVRNLKRTKLLHRSPKVPPFCGESWRIRSCAAKFAKVPVTREGRERESPILSLSISAHGNSTFFVE